MRCPSKIPVTRAAVGGSSLGQDLNSGVLMCGIFCSFTSGVVLSTLVSFPPSSVNDFNQQRLG